MNLSNLFVFSFFVIILSVIFNNNAYAEENISFSKTLDVEKNILQETITNVQNYGKVFPDYVKSVKTIGDSKTKTLTELTLGFGMIPLSVKVEHNVIDENIHELSIVSGDLKGSKIITKLERTWGYDGTPGKGTRVNMDLSLHVSGFLGFLGIVSDDLIQYSIDHSLLRLVDYSKGDFIEEMQKTTSHPRKSR